VDEYGGRQCVGIDLHRRRRVMVRMTPEGERLGTAVRVDSSPFELAEQVGSWGEGLHPLLWSDVTRMTTTRYHPAGDRHEIVVPRVEHAPKPPVAEPAHLADSAVGIDQMDTGRPKRSPVTTEFHRGPHGHRTSGRVARGVRQVRSPRRQDHRPNAMVLRPYPCRPVAADTCAERMRRQLA
jgi:hypothetical protein